MARTIAVAVSMIIVLFGSFSLSRAEEIPLRAVPGKGNSLQIELSYDQQVRGVQFTVSGAKISEVRTTERSKGFLAKFNEKTGVVLMVAISGSFIPAGTGPIAEIVCDNPKGVSISGVTIVGAVPVVEKSSTMPDKSGEAQKNK